MDNQFFDVLTEEELKGISGGFSPCQWAIISCAHDSATVGFWGTSDPSSSCELVRVVCGKP